jgi:transposase
MDNSNISDLVLSYHSDGYSLQSIADEMGISKSAVYKIVQAYKANNNEDEPLVKSKSKPKQAEEVDTSFIELGQLRLELEHERLMKELDLEKLKLELNAKKAHQAPPPQVVNNQPSSKTRSKKEMLLKRYLSIADTFKGLIEDCEWDVDECMNFQGKADRLMEALNNYAEGEGFDPDDLIVIDNLEFILRIVSETIEEDETTSEGYLIFTLSEEDFEEVESLSDLDALDELFEE